ncbi:amino acid/polyamine transporter I [Cordyceps militaris CM01]|uniref:Amino acid/polyamine transporter I n=1 Tax=Cordyceps militaris (strain CM01) TaxID=983644 RepID=G3JSF1_CORMM|nr:amino acid/polyamine transporter I [Cordyceps militaris CM01]EGX88743.1 amino acid/polyamine transporter I [Cordyceps militaris CM01]
MKNNTISTTQPGDMEHAIAISPVPAAAQTTTASAQEDATNEKCNATTAPNATIAVAASAELAGGGTRRMLQQRHIQMMALAGTVGTGLFLSTGRALAAGGPLGLLLGYALIGTLVCAVVFSVAEMSALVPLSGGVVRHAALFADPALAFAQGWNSVYSNAVLLPAEMAACAVILDYWGHAIHHAVWITVLGGLLVVSNLFLVSVYGELEFACALLKMALISICITAGAGPSGHAIGFRYWRDPGPFAQFEHLPGAGGRFLGFWRVLLSAAYAFSNVENVSVAAAETQNPRHNIPKAARRVFWRVLLLYLATVLCIGLVVRSDDEALMARSGDAGASPFAIAAVRAGIKVVPSIINAVVVTSAWSAANSAMLVGTRTLYGLALDGHAPRFFTWTNRFGVPWTCVAAVAVPLPLGFMTLSAGAAAVFGWLQDLVAAATLVHWITIALVYLRFHYGARVQGIAREVLPWKAPFQPYGAWVALVSCVVLLLTGGVPLLVGGRWSPQDLFSAYFNVPLILALYFGYKTARGTKVVPLGELPIRHFVEVLRREEPEQLPPPPRGWRRLNVLWG